MGLMTIRPCRCEPGTFCGLSLQGPAREAHALTAVTYLLDRGMSCPADLLVFHTFGRLAVPADRDTACVREGIPLEGGRLVPVRRRRAPR